MPYLALAAIAYYLAAGLTRHENRRSAYHICAAVFTTGAILSAGI